MNPNELTGLDSFYSALDRCGRFAVTAHTHPDGDACGCVTAMKSFICDFLGKKADIVLPDQWGSGVDFLMKGSGAVLASEAPEEAASLLADADAVICLDFNTPTRLASLETSLRESKATKVLIDHHPGPEKELFDIVFSQTDVSSACELLFWILLQHPGIVTDPSALPTTCARSLMTGMTTDSNNFANSVFPSTLRMASLLLEAGVDREDILNNIYNEKRECVVRAWHYLLDRELHITDDGIAYIILSKELRQRFDLLEGDTDGLVNTALSIGRVRVSALLTEDEGHYRLSLRSKKDISVGALCRACFHGGGHDRAAGGKVFFPEDIASKNEIGPYFETTTARFLHTEYDVKK